MSTPFQELDPEPRPACRPITALGVLLAPLVARFAAPSPPERLHYWSNRPGQHREETHAVMWLVTLSVAGLVAGVLLDTVPSLAAILLLVPGFFFAIHLLIFAASGLEALLRLVGIDPRQAPGHFCGRLFLLLLTAASVLAVRPACGPVTRLSGGFWLLVTALNFLAWLVLVLRSLRDALRA